MKIDQEIFKAYDIRGVYPEQVDRDVAFAIGVAYAQFLNPKKIVVGRDVRVSGKELIGGLIAGLESENVEVTCLEKPITTELIYFATAKYGFDGGIVVSASHNPAEYNGFKLCRKGAIPISGENGIKDIQEIANTVLIPSDMPKTKPKVIEVLPDYFEFLNNKFIKSPIKNFSLVANSNFGMQADHLKQFISQYELDLNVIYLNDEPDGSFPKGRPDPMIPFNRIEISKLIKSESVDFGVAWDADGDRCFFFDGDGNYIDPYYINGLFIEYIFKNIPKAKVLQDCRLRWLLNYIAKKHKKDINFSRSGHSFIKEIMRKEKIYFGAETTAHYYFQDFYYADNGLIPLLWMLQILTKENKSINALIQRYQDKFLKTDELLFKVKSVDDMLEKLKTKYQRGKQDNIDGLSVEYEYWRFNARGSNTEPLLKINIESTRNYVLNDKMNELVSFIKSHKGRLIRD